MEGIGIAVESGEIALGDGLTLQPGMTIEAFGQQLDDRAVERREPAPGQVIWTLPEVHDGRLRLRVEVRFDGGTLRSVLLFAGEPGDGAGWQDWSEARERSRDVTHRRWLEDKGVALGEHAWGQVLAGFAPASGHSSIELRYGPATVSPGAPEEAAAALPLSHAQALRLAQQVFGEGLVVVEADTVERAWGWVFSATSATHASSGRDEDALIGLGCVLVDRRDGSVHTFGSSGPPGYWADEYERRRDGSWLSRLLRRLRGR